jgi:hypothetical protein
LQFDFFEDVKVGQKNTKSTKKSVPFSVVSVERKLAETTEYKGFVIFKTQTSTLLLYSEKQHSDE